MAVGDEIQRTSDTTPNDRKIQNPLYFRGSNVQTSPTFQQLLQRDGSKWSRISAQIKKIEDDENRHSKKSVLAKVKEKAKKLKLSLRRKKHNVTNESQRHVARSSGVGPKDKGEEEAEYHSARMLDSKQTLVSTSGMNLENLNGKQNNDKNESSSNTTEAHCQIHAKSNPSVVAHEVDTKNQATTTDVNKVHEFPQRNSRFSGLMVSTPQSVEDEVNMKRESHTRDKGVVSVKDYLMHKFEPGEDERALSKVITQTISPRRDKMRDAMSSFLRNEESCEVHSSNVDYNVDLDFKSKSLPTSTKLNTNTSSKTSPIKQSYSLVSNASKASLNLNKTFKSTFASYHDRLLGSRSNCNMILSHSSTTFSTNINPMSNQSLTNLNTPTETSSSSQLGPDQGASNETQAPSGAKKTPGHIATSVRRVHVSRTNQKRVPIHNETTNTVNSVSCV